jgi:redox-sensitive bicupin YhaK (pirin superfamily)
LHDGQLGILTDGDSIRFSVAEEAEIESEILLLAGPEIDEPIARYGPFVMNTEEEIHQAISDFNNGIFA